MRIYVPSYKRHELGCPAYETLHASGLNKLTWLVVVDHEAEAYAARYPEAQLLVCDFERAIGRTRNRAIDHAVAAGDCANIMQIDDDVFINAVTAKDGKAKATRQSDLNAFVEDCEKYLDEGNAMVGPIKNDRFGMVAAAKNNCQPVPYGKLFRVWAVNLETLERHDNLRCWEHLAEDYEIQLKLARRRERTLQLTAWSHDTTAPDKQGPTGCISYRNAENQRVSSLRLKKRYPEGVRLKEFTTNGFKRIDIELRMRSYAKSLGLI